MLTTRFFVSSNFEFLTCNMRWLTTLPLLDSVSLLNRNKASANNTAIYFCDLPSVRHQMLEIRNSSMSNINRRVLYWIQLKLIIIASFHFANNWGNWSWRFKKICSRFDDENSNIFDGRKVKRFYKIYLRKTNHSIELSSFSTTKFEQQQNSSSC